MNISIGFWDFIWKIFSWFKINRAEKKAEIAEDLLFKKETEDKVKNDVNEIRKETNEKIKKIDDLVTADDIIDSFKNL